MLSRGVLINMLMIDIDEDYDHNDDEEERDAYGMRISVPMIPIMMMLV